MKKKLISTLLGLTSTSILVAIGVAAFVYPEKTYPESQPLQSQENYDTTQVLLLELTERLANQEKVDSMIQAEVESGYYTPDNPLVILDPYSQSPLTALICFTTEEPTRVDIHVEGEDEYTEVNHSFSERTTQHVLPVYGLYPDKLNPVTVTVWSEQEESVAETICEIQTDPVSDSLRNLIILTETFQEGYQEGLNFLYVNEKMAFDKEGDIRWYLSKKYSNNITEYDYSNSFIMAKGAYHAGTVLFFDLDKLGKINLVLYSPYGAHHDVSVMKESLLVTGTNIIGNTVEDLVYEISLVSGEIVATLDLKEILQRTRPAWGLEDLQGRSNRADWLHLNSVEYDAFDGSIIVSSNYQSAVVKLDWPSGDIHWIMGNHNDWNTRLQAHLLTPVGNNFEWHYNQHAAEILPDFDNNSNTIDILLFDNGSTRFNQDKALQQRIANNEIVAPELYSRLVHYRINEITMEVEQIWQYGKEQGLVLYSHARSDADFQENGNIIGMFQGNLSNTSNTNYPKLVEVTQENAVIWEAEFFYNSATGDTEEYRAERLPFYFDDDAEHDIYSTARNLIPDEIMNLIQ